jgi:hypothetical protein
VRRSIAPDTLHIYAIAVACGLVAEIGLALAIFYSNGSALALLFFVEAVILGFVFGARPGIVAAIVPLALLYIAELIRNRIGSPTRESQVALAAGVVFLALVQAFLAGMAGALRERYAQRS